MGGKTQPYDIRLCTRIMKKVLIVSHLPISSTTNVGKTLFNLFSGYPYEDICQIFFTNQGLEKDGIKKYHISDRNVLNVLIKKTSTCGKATDNEQQVADSSEVMYNTRINLRSPFALLTRDVCWSLSGYYSKGIRVWLDSMKPNVIFLAPGYSIFAYKMAAKISRDIGIPLFVYFMEDFYNEKRFSLSPFYWIRYAAFRSVIRNTVKCSKGIFALNEALGTVYKKEFKRDVVTLFNPCNRQELVNVHKNEISEGVLKILYAGSIGYDRITVLERIDEAIRTAPKKVQLQICGACKIDEIKEKINRLENTMYYGLLNKEELEMKIAESDVLLHVESFDSKYIAKTKRALSTKIPEYLSSGKLILAIGPEKIESMDYLRRNNAAIVVNDLEGIGTQIENILNNSKQYLDVINDAKQLAERNHDRQIVQTLLYEHLN